MMNGPIGVGTGTGTGGFSRMLLLMFVLFVTLNLMVMPIDSANYDDEFISCCIRDYQLFYCPGPDVCAGCYLDAPEKNLICIGGKCRFYVGCECKGGCNTYDEKLFDESSGGGGSDGKIKDDFPGQTFGPITKSTNST